MRFTLVILAVLLPMASGCASLGQSMARDAVAQKGQVLREWKQGSEDWMLVREGNRVVEYRINTLQIGISAATQAHAVYSVDQVTRTCYAGAAPISCANLSRDPNIGPYVSAAYGRRRSRLVASAGGGIPAAHGAKADGQPSESRDEAGSEPGAPPDGPGGTAAPAPSLPTGRFLVDLHPLGLAVQFGNGGGSLAIYKLGLGFGGRIADLGKLTLWLGGEFNIGGRENYAALEPGVFVKLTFEKMMRIALMPFFKAGLAGGIDVFYADGGNNFTVGDLGVKLGGGVHYFVTRNIGLGVESDLFFGGRFGNTLGVSTSGFLGYWDFLAGAEFIF